jgi:2-dehydro-3-deoxyglucarate aldolase
MESSDISRPFTNPIKKALREGKPTIGSWITLGHPAVAEILSLSGFDWLVVDLEHSVIGLDEMQALFQAMGGAGTVPLVRMGENNPRLISRVMDAGAYGVIVSMVNSVEEAERAVRAVKYPPMGERGVGLSRAQSYGLSFKDYAGSINDESLVVVQIEHAKAVDALEDILAVEGVDAFFVGPYDLSASMGAAGDFENPKVKAALARVMDVGGRLGVPAGIHVVEPDTGEVFQRLDEGYRFIAFSVDMLFLTRTAANAMREIARRLGR